MNTERKHKFVLTTEIQINARPAIIWQILMDFEKYPTWNPFVKSIKGEAKIGNKIEVTLQPPNGSSMTLKPTILALTESKKFSWLGHLWIKGLFDGEHIFELIDNQNGSTTFRHMEYFNGILIPMFKGMLEGKTKDGFNQLNQKIKERAENVSARS